MNKPWLQSYPAGVPADIDTHHIPSLVELFEEACRRYADKVAYISMGRAMSFRELDEGSRAFAGWLQARGLKKGDRVALMMPNLLQYPVALFGTLRAGCVVVNCNPLYTPRELEHQLIDSGASDCDRREFRAHAAARYLEDVGSACHRHPYGRDARRIERRAGEFCSETRQEAGTPLGFAGGGDF